MIEEPALETKGTMERVDRLILDSLNFDVKDIMLRYHTLQYSSSRCHPRGFFNTSFNAQEEEQLACICP